LQAVEGNAVDAALEAATRIAEQREQRRQIRGPRGQLFVRGVNKPGRWSWSRRGMKPIWLADGMRP
jgi:hypothetical protein